MQLTCFHPRVWSVLLILAAPAAGRAAGEAILGDTFDDGNLNANPAWVVDSPSVTVEDGEMSFGGEGEPAVHLDFGDTAWKKPLEVAFALRQTNATTASHLFRIGLHNTDRDRGYQIACSPFRGYFGTSGFYDGTALGTKNAALRGDTARQRIVLRFDPVAGTLSLSQDGKIVWQGSNHKRLPRVNRLTLWSNGQVNWRVDEVSVEAELRDAEAKPDPGRAAVGTIYREAVPHTDKNGRRLMQFDPRRSFFQIGVWGVPMGEIWGTNYDLKVLTEAGINTIWPWSSRPEQALPEAQKAGLQVVAMNPLEVKTLHKYKDHPNLLGNVWMDEPTGGLWGKDMQGRFDAFGAYRKAVHAVAPQLPVFINDVPWITPPATEWWIRWNTAGDVSCHDNYPINHSGGVKSIGAIGPPVSLAVAVNDQKKPVWLIVGAFEQASAGGCTFRFPTPAQLRACVYTGLIHGATGIIYFTWDTYVCRDGSVIGMSPDPKVAYVPNPRKEGYTHPTPANPVQLVQSRALWGMATAVNEELRQLTPSLLSPTTGEDELSYRVFSDLSHSEHPVHCLLKPHPEGGYVLLSCNTDSTMLDCTLRFSKPLESARRMFANQPAWSVKPGEQSFTIAYEPFEVHVFHVRLRQPH